MKRGPRPGSRPARLIALQPGDALLFEAPPGRAMPLMRQISADATRNGLKIAQSLIVGVELSSRRVFEIIRVTKGSK